MIENSSHHANQILFGTYDLNTDLVKERDFFVNTYEKRFKCGSGQEGTPERKEMARESALLNDRKKMRIQKSMNWAKQTLANHTEATALANYKLRHKDDPKAEAKFKASHDSWRQDLCFNKILKDSPDFPSKPLKEVVIAFSATPVEEEICAAIEPQVQELDHLMACSKEFKAGASPKELNKMIELIKSGEKPL